MDAISDLSESIKNAMVSRVETQQKDSKVIIEARQTLKDNGYIVNFAPKQDFPDTTYAVIDGASIKERTQGMDLTCITVAGMSDGYFHYNLDEDDRPVASWSAVEKYTKGIENQVQTIMMLCEVAVMGKLKGYNYRGMDGAYSTSLLNLFLNVNESDEEKFRLILEFLDGEHQEAVFDGLEQLLYPPDDEHHHIIGIAKSDAGTSFVNEMKDVLEDGVPFLLPTDRVFASSMLKPGEMFTPMSKELGSELRRGIQASIEDMKISSTHKDYLQHIHTLLMGNKLDERVYSTYFCPSDNALPGKVMRVDFSLPTQLGAHQDKAIHKYAEKAIQVVNNDVVSTSLSEPYAQFKVDEFCKKVIRESFKQAKREARDIFDEQDPTGVLANNILESYRT